MEIYIVSTLSDDGQSMSCEDMKAFYCKQDAIEYCHYVSTEEKFYFFKKVEIIK